MKLWTSLGVAFLLIAAWGTSMRLSWSLGRENARNEAQASTLKSTVDTLNIISTGVQDMQQVLAQLRVENQQRNQDGEARREQLRNDIAKDECAHALPDARFTDRLRRHAERATASAVSPAYTADADHTGNASPLTQSHRVDCMFSPPQCDFDGLTFHPIKSESLTYSSRSA